MNNITNTTETIKNTVILLVDNGSTRVDAAVQLRRLASNLSDKTGKVIHPVSLKHSDAISADDVNAKLSGIPASVFSTFMFKQLTLGNRDFLIIPLFFGNSRALSSFVPDEKAKLETQFDSFNLTMTEVLYPLPDGEPLLIDILNEHAIATINTDSTKSFNNLVLVDHGSPLPAVNAVRQHIYNALNVRLPEKMKLSQAAMERRKGKKYNFNGELLEDYLRRTAKSGETHAVVLLLFLLPGTHAGKNGDITQICQTVIKEYPDFRILVSPLISQHEKLIDCLAQRLITSLT